MPELLARLSSVFVEPAPRRVGRPAPASRLVPEVALLCPPEDAAALGSAVALSLARRAKAPIALLLLWRPGWPSASALGAPSGRRGRALAASLRSRGLGATASGRLVRVELSDDPDAAVAAAARATAATDAPAAFACAGPRTDALDELLRNQDLVLLAAAEPEGPLVELALDRIAELGAPVAAIRAGLPPVSRALALAGLTPPTSMPLPEPAW
jgi:hypothetical protein